MTLLSPFIQDLLSDAKSIALAMHHDAISTEIFTLCIIRRLINDPIFKAVSISLSSIASEISKKKQTHAVSKSIKSSLELQKLIVNFIQHHPFSYSTTPTELFKFILTQDDLAICDMMSEYGITSNSIANLDKHNATDNTLINSIPPELESFCVDICNEASQGQLDPLAGREQEMRELIETLSKRKKNSPLLIGDAGVGKSAIVEGLAQKIHDKDISNQLSNTRIISVDLSAMVSGTKYRGEFEERINILLNYATSHPNVILFIDEIHNIVGTGSAEGSLDAANIIKPYLARGRIRCIGATTNSEFEKYIAHDKALIRRFSPIYVSEPSFEDTSAILQKVKSRYEEFHNVTYDDNVISTLPELIKQKNPDKALPDSAIDMLDILGAKISVSKRSNRNISIDDLERHVSQQ